MEELQKEIFYRISQNDLNGVRDLYSQNDIRTEIYDEHGMTPLHHAAYKGNKEMVRMLLDQGADVNSGRHEHSYTALHFGALSGNIEVCYLLLEHGAKPFATNTVGRTPAQMAAFVGNHSCVTAINNFVPKSEIEYYSIPQGFEAEPKLPPVVVGPLHKFVVQVNLNPVRVAINLIKMPLLFEYMEKVKYVLDLMSQREMRKGIDTSEIMAFKFHYLSGILEKIIELKNAMMEHTRLEGRLPKKETEPMDLFIKHMLKTNEVFLQENQEILLKEIIRDFPNRECTIFRQMICSLSREDSPSALSVITLVVNGQRGFNDFDVNPCATCDEEKASKKCSQCKSVYYCDRDCQKYHWFVHKRVCCRADGSEIQESDNEISKETAIRAATESLISEMKNLNTT